MPCACGEELLIDHEIQAGKCLVCMMLEFQEEIERVEEEQGRGGSGQAEQVAQGED